MAREKFLRNLRTAAGFLSPRGQVNGIRLDPHHLAQLLGRSRSWLTPQAVQGFDPDDFPELPLDERERLVASVAHFQEIAGLNRAQTVPTSDQLRDAAPHFLAILSAMWPYLEGFQVYAALKRQRFPEFVRDFAVKVGEDSTGDPAAWVWVIVADEAANETLFRRSRDIERMVEETMEQAGIKLYPYVHFRAVSEQYDLETSEKS
jgi:hypothetical protein